MKWKKVSQEKCDLLHDGLEGLEFQNRPMFGCPAYFVNNNWFSGVHEDNIIVKLSKTDRGELTGAFPGARPFEPMKGRPMGEMVVLPKEVTGDPKEFRKWLERAHAYARSLPPKERKPRGRRKP